MSTRTKIKNAFVGLFVMIAVVLIAVTVILVRSSIASSYSVASPGMIHRAYVTYKDSDTITIQPGYGECCFSYWEITSPVDHNMTSLATGEDFHYIYIDDVNSTYPTPMIIDSTVEPVWSDTRLGWYNNYDRCIGVVWSPDASATIMEFSSNSNQKYWPTTGIIKKVLDDGNPDETFQFLEASAYTPVNATAVFIETCNTDDTQVSVAVSAEESPTVRLRDGSAQGWAHITGWLDFPKEASRDLRWFGQDNDNNQFDVNIKGYQIER